MLRTLVIAGTKAKEGATLIAFAGSLIVPLSSIAAMHSQKDGTDKVPMEQRSLWEGGGGWGGGGVKGG